MSNMLPPGADSAVSDEELRLLEAMASMSQSMMQLNQVLTKLNRQTVELATEMRTAERQMSALYLPFQAAIYELQHRKQQQQQQQQQQAATTAAAIAVSDSIQATGARTEL
ncbi:hypothetical protein PINS_up013997 [Pythium insidiosum]|nr:hypothetical protein PINS_up013997 [Pythium insidiosum]